MRKKILAACFLKHIWFDSEETENEYLEKLKGRKRRYMILNREKLPDGGIETEIKEQYNNNIMF